MKMESSCTKYLQIMRSCCSHSCADWVQGKGKADGQRSVTAFYPENDEVSNGMSIILLF